MCACKTAPILGIHFRGTVCSTTSTHAQNQYFQLSKPTPISSPEGPDIDHHPILPQSRRSQSVHRPRHPPAALAVLRPLGCTVTQASLYPFLSPRARETGEYRVRCCCWRRARRRRVPGKMWSLGRRWRSLLVADAARRTAGDRGGIDGSPEGVISRFLSRRGDYWDPRRSFRSSPLTTRSVVLLAYLVSRGGIVAVVVAAAARAFADQQPKHEPIVPCIGAACPMLLACLPRPRHPYPNKKSQQSWFSAGDRQS